MSTAALPTQGIKLQVQDLTTSPISWVDIPEVSNISGPDGSKDEIEVTDFDSTSKEYIAGLPDWGSISFDINFRPAQVKHAQLFSDYSSSAEIARNYRILHTDSPNSILQFNAYVSQFSESAAPNDKVNSSVSLRIKTTPTLT